jgi:hypothetical protein
MTVFLSVTDLSTLLQGLPDPTSDDAFKRELVTQTATIIKHLYEAKTDASIAATLKRKLDGWAELHNATSLNGVGPGDKKCLTFLILMNLLNIDCHKAKAVGDIMKAEMPMLASLTYPLPAKNLNALGREQTGHMPSRWLYDWNVPVGTTLSSVQVHTDVVRAVRTLLTEIGEKGSQLGYWKSSLSNVTKTERLLQNQSNAPFLNVVKGACGWAGRKARSGLRAMWTGGLGQLVKWAALLLAMAAVVWLVWTMWPAYTPTAEGPTGTADPENGTAGAENGTESSDPTAIPKAPIAKPRSATDNLWALAQLCFCVVGMAALLGGICKAAFNNDSLNRFLLHILMANIECMSQCAMFFVELHTVLQNTDLLIHFHAYRLTETFMVAYNILKPNTYSQEALNVIRHLVYQSMQELEALGKPMSMSDMYELSMQALIASLTFEMLVRAYHQ